MQRPCNANLIATSRVGYLDVILRSHYPGVEAVGAGAAGWKPPTS